MTGVSSVERGLRPRKPGRTELRLRLRAYWSDGQWWMIGVLGFAALILGFVGLRDYATEVGGSTDFWDLLYRDLQLFLFAGAVEVPSAINPSLQVARFLAPAVASVALLRAFAPRFRDQLQLLRFRIARGHVVIGGLGNRGFKLATSLRERGHRVVVIEQVDANDQIASCRAAGVPVFVGDATDIISLRKAGAQRAAYVVALSGDEGVNAEIAVAAHQLAAGRKQPLSCIVHVTDPHLCSLLRARYLTAPDPVPFRLDFFNTYERGAQALLLRHPPFSDVDDPADPPPHILVVGLGRLGASLVVQAARNWQTGKHSPGRRLRITAVDKRADQKLLALSVRHPEVQKLCDVTALTIDVPSPEFEQCTEIGPEAVEPITAAYVCFDNDARSMETALVLHGRLRSREVPVVMRAGRDSGLPALLSPTLGAEFKDLHPFGLLDRTCDPDLVLGGTDEIIARALHDVYVHARLGERWEYGPERDEKERTTPSIAPWNELDESFRDANRDQAAHTAVKLAAVGCELEELADWHHQPFAFTTDEVELLAEMEHERWNVDQRRHGWKLGPRDDERKRSPYLVPWSDLPDDVKEYDREFVRGLPTILAKLGYRIVRIAPEKTSAGT